MEGSDSQDFLVLDEDGSNADREHVSDGSSDVDSGEPLLPFEKSEEFRHMWTAIQADFVDRPRESVERADGLVVDVMQRVTSSLSQQRGQLEAHWEKGEDVSTEDLRIALTLYRSFFNRLLSA